MINPFFVPVTHIDPIINAIEGVALIAVATLLGVALTWCLKAWVASCEPARPIDEAPVDAPCRALGRESFCRLAHTLRCHFATNDPKLASPGSLA
jgi:hypothetical protein